LTQIQGLQVKHNISGSKDVITDTKVSEQYDGHQSSMLLGDTKSTQSAVGQEVIDAIKKN
jgi:hypothetical protein